MQPTGTVTLLFSDIEGSTRLLERLGPASYADALATHREILRSAFVAHDGYEVDTAGDSFFVAFARAADAVAAAGEAQLGLASATWPEGMAVRVRIGVHTGEPVAVASGYVGIDVHRAARIMAAAHGGQVVVSGTTHALLDGSTASQLRDLGPHRLKDLLAPVALYQLVVVGQPAEFPPLRSLHRSNLPVAAWPLLGRERELAELRRLVTDGARLVTLTGPGGTGKTRLALQSAADLSDAFPDGVFFAPLAALRAIDAVRPAVAEALGLQPDDDPATWLRTRTALVVLDNLEQLGGVAGVVAPLLVGGTVILATSRSPLHLSAEHEFAVAPLDDDAAVELFVGRAAATGRRLEPDAIVRAICRRLDNLPLAVELAAARTKLLPPASLLQRLDAALPMLAGGAADLPERQRTLRAAIAWSHDLLDELSRAAFRRLSVFRGSYTLEAAEAVADADLDAVAALVDQSLVVARPDGRFLILETIREFARGCLDEAGETRAYVLRHARYFLGQMEAYEPLRYSERAGEILAWHRTEEENLGTMMDRLTELVPVEATRAVSLLSPYLNRWGAAAEARRRLRALLDDERLGDADRATLLARLAPTEDRLGNVEAATEAAIRAEALSRSGDNPRIHVDALGWMTIFASRRGDADASIATARRSLEEAAAIDEATRNQALYDLGSALGMAGRVEEARPILHEAADEARAMGHIASEAFALYNLGEMELHEHDFDAARVALERALVLNDRLGDTGFATWSRVALALALVGLDRRRDARRVLRELLDLLQEGNEPLATDLGATISAMAFAAGREEAAAAARLRGAALAIVDARRTELGAIVDSQAGDLDARLIRDLGDRVWADERAAGASMSLDDALSLARSLAD